MCPFFSPVDFNSVIYTSFNLESVFVTFPKKVIKNKLYFQNLIISDSLLTRLFIEPAYIVKVYHEIIQS